MKISMYEASIPTFLHSLRSLKAILQKGVAHAESKKYDPNLLAATRLAADMLPLTRQVQIASDAAKGAAELIARVDKTIDYLQSFKPEQLDGSEDRTITIPTPRQTFTFQGLIFLRHWALPNFFFHVTTAYNLLRHNGVEIGKADYLGKVS
jgi:hypothetical protein